MVVDAKMALSVFFFLWFSPVFVQVNLTQTYGGLRKEVYRQIADVFEA